MYNYCATQKQQFYGEPERLGYGGLGAYSRLGAMCIKFFVIKPD